MEAIIREKSKLRTRVFTLVCFAMLVAGGLFATYAHASAQSVLGAGQRLVTIHDRGQDKGVLTTAATLRQALQEANIHLDPNDTVEPGLDEPLVATNYDVNIYRARPVTIVDGSKRTKVMSPYQTAAQIAQQAGVTLRSEDRTELSANTDMVSQGAGVQLTIDRATRLNLVLYGTKTTVYSHQATVAGLLQEKQITLAESDTTSVPLDTKITQDMTIELWRNGIQTVTIEEEIGFEEDEILDTDFPVGYREIKTPGEAGRRTITYEVNMMDGVELSRHEIQNVVIKQPQAQVVTVGTAPAANALTRSKGAQHYTDSNGVSHRETYYDLPMNVVMNACGGGAYHVRADGAKVDQDGYILIAANLHNYPRCSVVETSMGLGKVYDTGGFAIRHPHGFDLATDWTNYDGI